MWPYLFGVFRDVLLPTLFFTGLPVLCVIVVTRFISKPDISKQTKLAGG